MLASAVPAPVRNVRPVVPLKVSVALVLESVTLIGLDPASGSLTEMRLPLAVEKTRAVSSFVVWAPGTVLTGAWLAATLGVSVRFRTALGHVPFVVQVTEPLEAAFDV